MYADAVTATSVGLVWDQVGIFDAADDEYQVQQSIDQGVTWADVTGAPGKPTTNMTTVTTLTTATNYWFRVAYNQNKAILGDYSKPVIVTTL